MAKLKAGEVSGPVRSPLGWHLILVEERRTQDVTQDRKRDVARNAIRARKADEQFSEFMRQVRDKAYVEYKTEENKRPQIARRAAHARFAAGKFAQAWAAWR
jgi:peptidyl-prolyl cis-trans isomerase SurA